MRFFKKCRWLHVVTTHNKLLQKALETHLCSVQLIFFLHNFFFFLKLLTTEKPILHTIDYKQTKRKKTSTSHVTCPSVNENQLLLPTPSAYPYTPPHLEAESDKVSNSFDLQNIFNLLPFSLVQSIFFFIAYWHFFLYVFNFCDFSN